jgi:DNA polymerase-1
MLLPQYRGLVCWDFEYRPDVNGRPVPVCASFLEMRSNQRVQLREGGFGTEPPFDMGRDMLWITYHASAETGCHLVLGWSIPENTLDLEAEFRLDTTGYAIKQTDGGKGLLGCVKAHGLDGLDVAEKKSMRDLIMFTGPHAGRTGPYTSDEWQDICAYNWGDTLALAQLLPRMLPAILARPNGWPLALWRGHYSARVVGRIEDNGIPIDTANWRRISEHRGALKHILTSQCNELFDLYEGDSWNNQKFVNFLVRNDIPWPTYPDGTPIQRDDTFREMSDVYGELYPQIAEVRQFQQTLAQLRESKLFVGADGRNRCMLGQFVAATGRNAPQAGKYIFGQASWMRHLVMPHPDRALAYIDWDCQEFVVAAAGSGDKSMLEAAATGDPHMAFAILAGNAPPHATKKTHGEIRKPHKACNLGVLYGMGARALAFQARKSETEARELLNHHRRVFPTYWAWSHRAVTEASLFGYFDLSFGWRVHDGPDTDPPTLMNAPMQGNAAEMMRIAACLGTRAGVQIDTILHDAFLIEADVADIDDAVTTMCRCMDRASEIVLTGVIVGTSVNLIMPGARYVDEDRPAAIAMWERVMHHLDEIERETPRSQPMGCKYAPSTPPMGTRSNKFLLYL